MAHLARSVAAVALAAATITRTVAPALAAEPGAAGQMSDDIGDVFDSHRTFGPDAEASVDLVHVDYDYADSGVIVLITVDGIHGNRPDRNDPQYYGHAYVEFTQNAPEDNSLRRWASTVGLDHAEGRLRYDLPDQDTAYTSDCQWQIAEPSTSQWQLTIPWTCFYELDPAQPVTPTVMYGLVRTEDRDEPLASQAMADIAPDRNEQRTTLTFPDRDYPRRPSDRPTAQARDVTDTCDDHQDTGFADTDGTAHEYNVRCIVGYEITRGKSDGAYDPSGLVSWGQTYTFLLRTMRAAVPDLVAQTQTGRDYCAERWTDAGAHKEALNYAIDAGIDDTAICGRGANTISRRDMADVVDRWLAAHVPAYRNVTPTGDYFIDDGDENNADYQDAHNRLAEVGIITGDGYGYFRPTNSLSRAQMASFVARTLDYALNNS